MTNESESSSEARFAVWINSRYMDDPAWIAWKEQDDYYKSRMEALEAKVKIMESVVEAANELEKWLSDMAGDNCDWPISIVADNKNDAYKISELLTTLKTSLNPYRSKESSNE